jgi:hypothetical protein
MTFPSPVTRDTAVRHVHVEDGIYERGSFFEPLEPSDTAYFMCVKPRCPLTRPARHYPAPAEAGPFSLSAVSSVLTPPGIRGALPSLATLQAGAERTWCTARALADQPPSSHRMNFGACGWGRHFARGRFIRSARPSRTKR